MPVAERMYARALFEAAQEQGSVAGVRGELGALATAIGESHELSAFLGNPQLDPGAKADVLGEITTDADPLVHNFVRLVATKGRAGSLQAIAAELDKLADAAEGRITVELTTAHELTDDEADAIVRRIEVASGRSVEATRSVDPRLIGGLILQVGSLRVDASVRGRLDRLRRDLVTRT